MPSTSAAPLGCPTVDTSGGTSKPVSQGESARTIQPDGAITNARPIANAECGVARIGASHAAARGPHARPAAHAQNPNARNADSSVAAKPVTSVSRTLDAKPGLGDELAPRIERERVPADRGKVTERGGERADEPGRDRQRERRDGERRRETEQPGPRPRYFV
jgi:hypothetical protein